MPTKTYHSWQLTGKITPTTHPKDVLRIQERRGEVNLPEYNVRAEGEKRGKIPEGVRDGFKDGTKPAL